MEILEWDKYNRAVPPEIAIGGASRQKNCSDMGPGGVIVFVRLFGLEVQGSRVKSRVLLSSRADRNPPLALSLFPGPIHG